MDIRLSHSIFPVFLRQPSNADVKNSSNLKQKHNNHLYEKAEFSESHPAYIKKEISKPELKYLLITASSATPKKN